MEEIETIQKECKLLIDACFEVKKNEIDAGAFERHLKWSELMQSATEKATDDCVRLLNTKNPDIAFKVSQSGFISDYIQEKQKDFFRS
jgi:hypothetical protein